ncbi:MULTISPECIES: (2Fe-2S)-binding protein [Gordonia]|uniref:(2Fe-2S)-binding protein n=1 Tax=Gordonia TaxID=2053 RepID=UPI0009FEC57A|nr:MULTISPECIES: (2Fe-2S)-binding protein [Gordonia]UEA59671.1 (2Fe-2S)-binding protein [Gordonia otitidis]
MFVCICRAVTVDEVHEHCDAGADTPDAVSERCGAGEGCGTCIERLTQIVSSRCAGRVATTSAA